MKRISIFFSLLMSVAFANAQNWVTDGTPLKHNMVFSDIKGNTHDVYSYLNQGKYVIFDLSRTNCTYCYNLHASKQLDNYYDEFGPSGTTNYEAEMFLYECNATSGLFELAGQDANAFGNWLNGSVPIVNEYGADLCSGMENFVDAGCNYAGTPHVFVVCPNKKMYTLMNGGPSTPALSTTPNSYIKSMVQGFCGASLSTNDVIANGFSFNVYPNPTANTANIKLNLLDAKDVQYVVTNNMGQVVVKSETTKYAAGAQQFSFDTQNWTNGLYFVNIIVGGQKVSSRLVVAH